MPKVVPSILEETLEGFDAKLAEVLKINDLERVQIDFSDGEFTSHKTISVSDLDVLNPAYVWEAHLMVKNPRAHFFDCKIAGFNCIIFHFEAIADKEKLTVLVDELKSYKIEAGLAINPETEIEQIYPYLHLFEQILIMSVHPGYQGQEFIESSFQKIEKLRKEAKNVIIEVDGAVKLDNAQRISELGADLLVVGSALFEKHEETDSPNTIFEKLNAKITSQRIDAQSQ